MEGIEFTDRYQALGIPYPEPATVCKGHCEGTGYVPIHRDDDDPNPQWQTAWKAAHAEAGEHDCGGWHFVKCPDCGGTGRAK